MSAALSNCFVALAGSVQPLAEPSIPPMRLLLPSDLSRLRIPTAPRVEAPQARSRFSNSSAVSSGIVISSASTGSSATPLSSMWSPKRLSYGSPATTFASSPNPQGQSKSNFVVSPISSSSLSSGNYSAGAQRHPQHSWPLPVGTVSASIPATGRRP